MHEPQSESELVRVLQSSYQMALSGVIGIDGRDGTGKTTLASAIQSSTGGTVISLDECLVKNQGAYIRSLKKVDLRSALDVPERPLIVEGICLLQALAAVSATQDILIYVKQVLKYSLDQWYWHDEDICDPKGNVEELIQGLSPITPLKEEIIRYHQQFRPSRRADITYLRFKK